MTSPQPGGSRGRLEVLVTVGIVFVIGLLVLPLPPILLDLLLALSIASSLVVLLVTLYTDRPLDFSAFPSVLLLLTVFRLALNVSSTRLILGEGQAGKMIESFGNFVIGGNYAVGVVVFLILVGINFIVITKGAGRVAEVAARFTLDAMPGRQMSIDGDLSAGLIDEEEAKRRREEISREADFFGAMDGSAKFVRGDAIAGLLITLINILGGLFIGVVQRGMPLSQALQDYTLLTVGDGLVSQIPALVISTAAGIMVTSSSGGDRVAEALVRQVGRKSKPMWITSGVLAALALVKGLPTLPFLLLSAGAAASARATKEQEDKALAPAASGGEVETLPPEQSNPVHDLLQIDPVEVEVGYALIPLIDETRGGDLLERIRLLRKQAAQELGILIPPIRIRDDVRLQSNEYIVKIRGVEAGRAEVMPRLLLALDTGSTLREIEGVATTDPSFGMPARWIAPNLRVDAEGAGYVVVEPSTVVATHLMESLKRHASELLGRQDVQEMVDTLKASHPALVEEVVPAKVPLGVLHRVLQRLLKERIPIRNLVTILETLADASEHTKDPEALTEYARRSLSSVIWELHQADDGVVRAITVGPRLEAELMRLFSPRAGLDTSPSLDPDRLTTLLAKLERLHQTHSDGGPLPIVTPPGLRLGVRRLVEPVFPHIPVVSLAELPPQVDLKGIASWELDHAA